MARKKGLSMKEILDLLEDDDLDLSDVYLEPPEVHDESDEDSADENEGGLIENLTGRQLRAPAEAVLADGRRIGNEDIENEDNEEGDQKTNETKNGSKQKTNSRKKKKVEQKVRSWSNDDILQEDPLFPVPDFSIYRNKTCTELFEIFIDNDIIDFLVIESNKYAAWRNCPCPDITAEEMKCFLGILILSGYNKLPGKKCYWDSFDDMRNSLVYNAMRRDRFIQIMRFLHCADNSKLGEADKMCKLRPLMNKIKSRLLHNFKPEREINYDESMIEYYGQHGCKQFLRGKPIRFGYKVWSLNKKNGYLINFEVYQGSIPNARTDYQEKYGKAVAPMLQMVDDLPDNKRLLPYRFYFDNLFTGIDLLRHLEECGYKGTGTIRKNRVPKCCPISKPESMKKKERGSYEYAYSRDENILITRWMDNSVVTVASNVHGISPLTTADRYSQAAKNRVKIPRPNAIAQYNKYMGGTDQMDANIAAYRIGIRGKKWWWCIFTWLLDVCINNSWIIKRETGSDISQLDFRREIVQTYLTRYQNTPKGGGRPSTSKSSGRVIADIRYDRMDHFVENVPEGKRRRCDGELCKSVGRTQCKKCGVGLCVGCFVKYHTQ